MCIARVGWIVLPLDAWARDLFVHRMLIKLGLVVFGGGYFSCRSLTHNIPSSFVSIISIAFVSRCCLFNIENTFSL